MSKFVSAQYMNTDFGTKIKAIDADGRVWWLDNQCKQGDWLEYVKGGGVIAPADSVPTPPTSAEKNQAILDEMMLAKNSPLRGVVVLMFKEINKLRVKNGDAPYPPATFWTAYLSEMDGS